MKSFKDRAIPRKFIPGMALFVITCLLLTSCAKTVQYKNRKLIKALDKSKIGICPPKYDGLLDKHFQVKENFYEGVEEVFYRNAYKTAVMLDKDTDAGYYEEVDGKELCEANGLNAYLLTRIGTQDVHYFGERQYKHSDGVFWYLSVDMILKNREGETLIRVKRNSSALGVDGSDRDDYVIETVDRNLQVMFNKLKLDRYRYD